MLDQLEDAGHVKRIHSKEDKRTISIKLTKMNEDLKEKFIRVSDQMKAVFYKDFSEWEIDIFEEYLKRIMDNLTNYNKNNKLS
jgi:DNA-binding MarR family transcriptional regulator